MPLGVFSAHLAIGISRLVLGRTSALAGGLDAAEQDRERILHVDIAVCSGPGEVSLPAGVAIIGELQTILEEDAYLVFRTRVKTDAKGSFVSADYGVIQGPWNFDGQVMSIPDGCFNPTPNDLNIEDGRALRENLRCQTR